MIFGYLLIALGLEAMGRGYTANWLSMPGLGTFGGRHDVDEVSNHLFWSVAT